jgi:hypothetical protein
MNDLISDFSKKQKNKMLEELKNASFCQTCSKYIFKYVYSERNADMICCSSECVDNYNDAKFYYKDL